MQALRLLHLEDDPFFADMVSDLLKANGLNARIRRAEDWDSFETALHAETFDLILSDHQIPGGDGLKALSLCRRQCPTVPFIFLSGMLGEELAIQSLKNGAADYVLKSNLSRLIPTVMRTLSSFRETAALKAAEARIRRDRANLHGLIENTTDAIWSMDLDFNILVFNSAASLLSLKMTGQPMVEGSCLLDLLAPEMQTLWKEAARRIRKADRFVQELELAWPGGKGILEISFHPIAAGKHVTGMALFAKDVTERKRIERAGAELEEKRRRLNGLYRKMRIPVTGLTRMAELLGRTLLDEGQRRYLGMMRSSAERISELHEKAEAYETVLQEIRPEEAGRDSGKDEAAPEAAADEHAAPAAGNPAPADSARAGKSGREPRADQTERRKSAPDPLRILVVEDNDVNTIVVLGYLDKLGFAADVAVNGLEAVEACEKREYDLILMDCQMPLMDGIEATATIRAMEAKTGFRSRITAMTADVTSENRARCMAAGMDAYMTKPLNLEILRAEAEKARVPRESRPR